MITLQKSYKHLFGKHDPRYIEITELIISKLEKRYIRTSIPTNSSNSVLTPFPVQPMTLTYNSTGTSSSDTTVNEVDVVHI